MKFNKLVPELKVTNFEKSLMFYTKYLGFKIEYQREEFKFAFLSLQGSQIMIEEIRNGDWKTGKLEHPFGRGIHLQMQVKSIKPIIASLKKNNCKLFAESHDKWYRKDTKLLGNRQFLVQDPDGYLLRFFEDLGSRPVAKSI